MRHFSQSSTRQEVDTGLRQYILDIYSYMGLGLALTGVLAYLVASHFGFIGWGGQIVSMLGCFGIVMYFQFAILRSSFATVQLLFWAYAALMGVMISPIFLAYHPEVLLRASLVTAGTFGAASVYGHITKRDLTSLGSFMMIGLIGVIIASLVNMFFRSPAMDYVISMISVAVFLGLTAYDTQMLKRLYFQLSGSPELKKRVAISGALSLYMDVINLFLSLLRLMGNDRK